MTEVLELKQSQIVRLPVDIICPNPYQPRRVFEKAQIEDLAKSIREFGVIQPVTVRLINGVNYELVAGERRLRASRLAGKHEIPAIIVSINDQDSAMLALIENLQRKDLNFFEEAEGYQSLISDFGLTQERLALRVGKNQSTVANKIRLLKLPRDIRETILENSLTERHARAFLKLDSPDRLAKIIEKVVSAGLNVSETEKLIDAELNRAAPREPHTLNIKTYIKDLRIFTNTIKQAIKMMNNSGVNTVYEVEESADGCFITIAVSY